MMRAVAWAVVLIAAMARAQPGPPGVGMPRGIELFQSGVRIGELSRLDLDATDFACMSTSTGVVCHLGANVTEVGTCVGESTDWCSTLDISGKLFDGRNATGVLGRTATSVPGGTCTPGDLLRVTGSATTVDRLCFCAPSPCVQASDCGSGTCTASRCTAGTTAGRWQCTTADPLWGDGSDGAFYFPTATGGSTCSTYASAPTLTTGAVCPPLCTTCANVTGGDATAGCKCTLTVNSRIGAQGTGAAVSVFRQFTTVWVGNKNQVLTSFSQGDGCGTGAGTMLWLKVQGDLTIEGGTGGAKIDLKGKGACGGSGNQTIASGVGGGGGGHQWAGGAAGAATPTAGGNGVSASGVFDALPYFAGPIQLFGMGGGKAYNGTAAAYANIVDEGPRYGGTGGGGGGCKNDAQTGCSGNTGTNTGGGGGVLLDIGGTFTLGTNSTIDTSGATVSANVVGGGGGGSIVVRYGTAISKSGSYVQTGATGGAACGSLGGGGANIRCLAGGNGGAGGYAEIKWP
jgi:hypothetical protein